MIKNIEAAKKQFDELGEVEKQAILELTPELRKFAEEHGFLRTTIVDIEEGVTDLETAYSAMVVNSVEELKKIIAQ